LQRQNFGVKILTFLADTPMSISEANYMATRLLWIGADLAITDVNFRRALPGVYIDAVSGLEAAVGRVRSQYNLAVLSIESVDCAADEAFDRIARFGADIPVIVYHRSGTVDDVIHFTRLGAFYTFIGELEPQALLTQISRLTASVEAKAEVDAGAAWRRSLIGNSRSMLQICEIIQLIASKRCTVLISGETGTGKEVIAKAIHAASNRAMQPMVSVNCTALPASLIETELFGHAKGAFTGAHASRLGRFEQAHRGSIFLDEIGDLPLDAQAKLLRVLQEQEFQRVGSSETVKVDVRVLAATNVDLEQAIRERKFREDLYYRLNVVPIHLPPLRERREDIPRLLQFFLEKIRAAEGAQPKQISDEAIAYLQQKDWPGNIRQLEHAVQMAFALSGDRCILTPGDFFLRQNTPAEISAPRVQTVELPLEGLNFDAVVSGLELSLLNQALKMSGGNKARAADLLGIKRTTLLAKMKSLETVQEACA
jgi:DNA-binding NtrC family response regulator